MTKNPRHLDGCPLARPWLYDPDEGPLECQCADLRVEYDPTPEDVEQALLDDRNNFRHATGDWP